MSKRDRVCEQPLFASKTVRAIARLGSDCYWLFFVTRWMSIEDILDSFFTVCLAVNTQCRFSIVIQNIASHAGIR